MVEETEAISLWVVSGGDVQTPKVFAISKQEIQAKANQEVLRQWTGGHVGQMDRMNESEPKFPLNMQSSSTVVFQDKVVSLESAWKSALHSTAGVKMWGFYKASGAIDKETAGAKLILSTISACAVKPTENTPGLAKILEAVSKGATLKKKTKLISAWRVSQSEGGHVFAPFGVALIAARKLNLSSPTEISDN